MAKTGNPNVRRFTMAAGGTLLFFLAYPLLVRWNVIKP